MSKIKDFEQLELHEQKEFNNGIIQEIGNGLSLVKGDFQSPNFVKNVRGWRLDNLGNIFANNGSFKGTITASDGTIGGWTIGANDLSNGNIKLNSANEQILLGSATAPATGIGIFIGKDGTDYEFRAGDPTGNYFWWDGTNIKVTGGDLTDSSLNANSVDTAEIVDLAVTNTKIKDLAVDKLTTGTITSKAITLAISAGTGDVKIQAGKTDFGQDATNGFILGLDDSDTDKAKFEIGSSPTKILKYDGIDLTLIGGTITAGTVRTASGNPRVELNGANNRLNIYNSAGSNVAFFGNDGANGNIIQFTQTDTNEDFPPFWCTSAQDSNVFNCFNTNSTIANRPAFRFESNNTVSESMYVLNTGTYIAGIFESNSTLISEPSLMSKNTGTGGFGFLNDQGHCMLANGNYNTYIRFSNTYLHVDVSGDLMWNNATADEYIPTSSGNTGGTTTANGTVELRINNTVYYLLKASSA